MFHFYPSLHAPKLSSKSSSARPSLLQRRAVRLLTYWQTVLSSVSASFNSHKRIRRSHEVLETGVEPLVKHGETKREERMTIGCFLRSLTVFILLWLD